MKKADIAKLVSEGYSDNQARYILDSSRRDVNKPYRPRPRKGWLPKDFEDLNIQIWYQDDAPYNWIVHQNGKKRTIFTAKGTVYKTGGCKYYPAVTIMVNGKQRILSLAAAIWVGALKRAIPTGYVVDHIDNDSFNNLTSNLQLLTIRENIEKNPSKKLTQHQALAKLYKGNSTIDEGKALIKRYDL